MLDREQSSIISWPRIPLPQDSQDFLPVETAKVTFHFRCPPPPPRKESRNHVTVEKQSSKDNCTATSTDRCLEPQRFYGACSTDHGTRANIPSSLSRSRALARDVSCNAEKSLTEILIRVCSTNLLVARNLVFVSLFNCLVSLPNWAEHGFNAS